jgi:hypothetical protein
MTRGPPPDIALAAPVPPERVSHARARPRGVSAVAWPRATAALHTGIRDPGSTAGSTVAVGTSDHTPDASRPVAEDVGPWWYHSLLSYAARVPWEVSAPVRQPGEDCLYPPRALPARGRFLLHTPRRTASRVSPVAPRHVSSQTIGRIPKNTKQRDPPSSTFRPTKSNARRKQRRKRSRFSSEGKETRKERRKKCGRKTRC